MRGFHANCMTGCERVIAAIEAELREKVPLAMAGGGYKRKNINAAVPESLHS